MIVCSNPRCQTTAGCQCGQTFPAAMVPCVHSMTYEQYNAALLKRDAEIERLRAALYDAREYVEHQVKTTGTVWAQDRLNKIDAALGNQQSEGTK